MAEHAVAISTDEEDRHRFLDWRCHVLQCDDAALVLAAGATSSWRTISAISSTLLRK